MRSSTSTSSSRRKHQTQTLISVLFKRPFVFLSLLAVSLIVLFAWRRAPSPRNKAGEKRNWDASSSHGVFDAKLNALRTLQAGRNTENILVAGGKKQNRVELDDAGTEDDKHSEKKQERAASRGDRRKVVAEEPEEALPTSTKVTKTFFKELFSLPQSKWDQRRIHLCVMTAKKPSSLARGEEQGEEECVPIYPTSANATVEHAAAVAAAAAAETTSSSRGNKLHDIILTQDFSSAGRTKPQTSRRGGGGGGGQQEQARDSASSPPEDFALYFVGSGTFLSRELQGQMRLDVAEAKSFEHWRFIRSSQTLGKHKQRGNGESGIASTSSCANPFTISPAPSKWQPGIENQCVLFSNRPQNGAAAAAGGGGAVTLVVGDPAREKPGPDGTFPSCATFCAKLVTRKTILVKRNMKKKKKKALADNTDGAAEVAGPVAFSATSYYQQLAKAEVTERKAKQLQLAIVSSLKPLKAMMTPEEYTQLLSVASSQGSPDGHRDGDRQQPKKATLRTLIQELETNEWKRQLLVMERWHELVQGTEQQQRQQEPVSHHCPVPKGGSSAIWGGGGGESLGLRIQVLLCVEDPSDITVLLSQYPEMFASHNAGGGKSTSGISETTSSSRGSDSNKILLTKTCEKHQRFNLPTYRGLFAIGEKLLLKQEEGHGEHKTAANTKSQRGPNRSFVMYSNSDILYSRCELWGAVTSSSALLSAVANNGDSSSSSSLFVTGRRRNCDLQSSAISAPQHQEVHLEDTIEEEEEEEEVRGGDGGEEAGAVHGGGAHHTSVAGGGGVLLYESADEDGNIDPASLQFRGGHVWDDMEIGPTPTYPHRAVHCGSLWRNRWLSRCPLFEDTAQDYFLVSVGAMVWEAEQGKDEGGEVASSPNKNLLESKKKSPWNSKTDAVPPLVVGGVAFDNWLTSTLIKRQDVISIDATNVINALHVNHGGSKGLRGSHLQEKSKYNSQVAHEHGGWSKGKTTLAPYALLVEGTLNRHTNSLLEACVVVAHERYVLGCSSVGDISDDGGEADNHGNVVPTIKTKTGCSIVHPNQDVSATEPPNAFDRPWQRAD